MINGADFATFGQARKERAESSPRTPAGTLADAAFDCRMNHAYAAREVTASPPR
jgi:hypothetical protein